MVSALLDLALAATCGVLAVMAARTRRAFLFAGFAWIGAAALVGGIRFAGVESVAPTHDWLSAVGRGPATMALGLGALGAIYGSFVGAAYLAHGMLLAGAVAVHATLGRGGQGAVLTAMGAVLLLALVRLMVEAIRRGAARALAASIVAAVLLLFAGFGVAAIPQAAIDPLARVDLLHLALIGCYVALWVAVGDLSRRWLRFLPA